MWWSRTPACGGSAFQRSATAAMPRWFPPLSPIIRTSVNPLVARLRATSVSTISNVSWVRLNVPGKRMWPVGGS